MNNLNDHIRSLYLEKLVGVISKEDEKALQNLLNTQEEAREIWKELEETNKEIGGKQLSERLNVEQELLQWHKKGYVQPKTNIWNSKLWKSVAAAAVVLLATWVLWPKRQNAAIELAEVNIVQPTHQNVTLTLSGGEVVKFSSAAEQLTTEDVTLSHSGGELVFTPSVITSKGLNVLDVPAMLDYNITLSDGTKIFLNSNSQLRFPFQFSGDKREVYIEGEAYLEVATDTSKPFVVHTSLADVNVLGTKFNINTYQTDVLRTSLVEGSVQLVSNDKQIRQLKPGYETHYSVADGFSTDAFDAAETLAWRDGIYYFQNRKLKELSGVLKRWFDMEVVFQKEEIGEHNVSGLIEKGRLSDFLNALDKTAGVNHVISKQHIHLK